MMGNMEEGVVEGRSVLVVGGTGSLGQALVQRLLSGAAGRPERVVVLSRDEAKQHDMRIAWARLAAATDEVIYADHRRSLHFRIGDVRDPDAVAAAVEGMDVVVHAAALKQVPTCEYFPHEAMRTNVGGAHNLMAAVARARRPVEAVVGVSTDKAVQPVNVMGMTKALQERVMIAAQIGLPDPAMTRFLLPMSAAVDAVLLALARCGRGEVLVPRVGSARIVDVARALIGDRGVAMVTTGIRPGEKLHEVLISAEESHRAEDFGDHWRIRPMLPELAPPGVAPGLGWLYGSETQPLPPESVRDLLMRHGLIDEG